MRSSNKSHVAILAVPITAADREWIDSTARREERSRAAIVRRLIRLAAAADGVAPAPSNSEIAVPA